jgi:trans-aconitate 2-methyltransferase
MTDWDAARYHRLSDPQVAWGRAVLARLNPVPGERILDVGCGTGRLTMEMAGRPGIKVIGIDRSAAMLSEAAHRGQTPASHLHTTPKYVHGDGAYLPFGPVFDAVFSAATLHWIPNHDRLFSAVHSVLRAGGRLVAQCGGANNLDLLLDRTHHLMESPRYARFFGGWSDPWNFAGVEETRQRLERANLSAIDVSLEPAPVSFADTAAFADFISCVCVRHHVDRLPPEERAGFVAVLADGAADDDPPLTLDYWRLNICARKEQA